VSELGTPNHSDVSTGLCKCNVCASGEYIVSRGRSTGEYEASLVRVNPRESQTPKGDEYLGVDIGALEFMKSVEPHLQDVLTASSGG